MASFARPPVTLALAAVLGLCLSLAGAAAFTRTAPDETLTLRVIVVSGAEAACRRLPRLGAVKYLLDVSGFSETQVALATFRPPSDWNSEPRAGCDARRQSIASARQSVEKYLAPENASILASQPALDVMQLYIALGQLDAFEGRMDSAIARFEEARRVASWSVSSAASMIGTAAVKSPVWR
jgi:hypothetical protein